MQRIHRFTNPAIYFKICIYPNILTYSTEAYKKNTDKEKLYIWAADNFNRQIRQHYPTLSPMCLVAKNEFGVRYGFE